MTAIGMVSDFGTFRQAILRSADAALIADLLRTLWPVLVQCVDPERLSVVRVRAARQVGVVGRQVEVDLA